MGPVGKLGVDAGCTGVGWPAWRDQETDKPRGDAAFCHSPLPVFLPMQWEPGAISFSFQAAENSQPRATPCLIVESMRHPLSHEAPVTGPDSILGSSSDFPKGFFPSGGRAASQKTSVGLWRDSVHGHVGSWYLGGPRITVGSGKRPGVGPAAQGSRGRVCASPTAPSSHRQRLPLLSALDPCQPCSRLVLYLPARPARATL